MLEPHTLRTEMLGASKVRFTGAHPSPFLLVTVSGEDDPVAVHLLAIAGEPRVSVAASPRFATVILNRGALVARRPVAPHLRKPLAERLHAEHLVAVPLEKRPAASKPFAERISVGRAQNNDVVLRHDSVSKFHAWFEKNDTECYYVADANSTNRSLLNGEEVGRELRALEDGDVLVFGDVQVELVYSDSLWEAMNAAPL